MSDAVRRQFPPTLLITATRAVELSAAAYTQSRLIDLGRESDLQVWDWLGHAFHLTDTLPESQQALHDCALFQPTSRVAGASLGRCALTRC